MAEKEHGLHAGTAAAGGKNSAHWQICHVCSWSGGIAPKMQLWAKPGPGISPMHFESKMESTETKVRDDKATGA